MTILFRNARIFDGVHPELIDGMNVVVSDGRIVSVGAIPEDLGEVQEIDCRGRTLLPGLIDAHVHIIANKVDLSAGKQYPSYIHSQAVQIMAGMLDRGFTTVRDGGGADAGFVQAVEEGHLRSPRLSISGLALSQTGGHGDMRSTLLLPRETANHRIGSMIARIADGVSEVREAARDELRKGAHFIKIMASGGAASVTDPIDALQFSDEELHAIVQEARAWNTYVMAHAYTPAAISAVVRAGGRTIEHGNLLDAPTARLMREHGVYLVPTLVASDVLSRKGKAYGFSDRSVAKITHVCERGIGSVRIARENGVKIGFGSDLLGIELHPYQCDEFVLRAKAEPTVETLISATSVNAEMMMLKDKIGVIKPDAEADILVVDGDPTRDSTVFTHQGENIDIIMKGGKFYKNRMM